MSSRASSCDSFVTTNNRLFCSSDKQEGVDQPSVVLSRPLKRPYRHGPRSKPIFYVWHSPVFIRTPVSPCRLIRIKRKQHSCTPSICREIQDRGQQRRDQYLHAGRVPQKEPASTQLVRLCAAYRRWSCFFACNGFAAAPMRRVHLQFVSTTTSGVE